MGQRTIAIGSASKELRLIGWRVGWIVGRAWSIPDIQLVGMANVVVPVEIAQKAAQAALENSDDDCRDFTKELRAKRDLLMQELKRLPVGVPAGGRSFVLQVDRGKEATSALIQGGIVTIVRGSRANSLLQRVMVSHHMLSVYWALLQREVEH